MVVAILAIVNLFNYMDRFALSVLAPAIQADLHISDAQLGLLTGTAFAMFYAICAVPIGRWADRGNRRNIVAGALALWSVMTALSGAAQNFLQLLALRMGVGAGEAGGYAPAQSMLCDFVERRKRGGAFAVHLFGATLGMGLGLSLAGILAETVGWRWTFVVMGVPGILFALVVRFALKEPVRGRLDEGQEPIMRPSLKQTALLLWRNNTYRLIWLASVCFGIVNFGLALWWPSFFTRVHQVDLAQTGVSFGLASGVGATLGVVVGGVVADRAAVVDDRLPLKLAAVAQGLNGLVAVVALLIGSAPFAFFLAGLSQFFIFVASPAIMATMMSVLPANIRTTGSTITYLAATAIGGLGPAIIGALSDSFGREGPESLRMAMLSLILLIVPAVAALISAARSLNLAHSQTYISRNS